MPRPERKPTQAEKQQAREVSLRRIGSLFRDHTWPLTVVVLIIVVSSIVGRTNIPRSAPPSDHFSAMRQAYGGGRRAADGVSGRHALPDALADDR